MESGDGGRSSSYDPQGYIPQAAAQARWVMGEMELYRRELERPSRLVSEEALAEGRRAVEGVREALRELLDALEGGGSDGGGGGEPIEEQPKDA